MSINATITPSENEECRTTIDFSLSELAAEALTKTTAPLVEKKTIQLNTSAGPNGITFLHFIIEGCTVSGLINKIAEFEEARKRAEAALSSVVDIIEGL